MKLQQLSKEERSEMSFIEIARYIFDERREVIPFNELVAEIGKFLELTDSQLRQRMVQFYTDINIDGQFISLGENRWGLREWYPFDQIDEEVIIPTKPKKKKAKKSVDDDELEEEEYDLDEDLEDDEDDEEEEDESLEALREAEAEDDEDLIDDEFEIEEEELDIDEEDEEDEEFEEEEEK